MSRAIALAISLLVTIEAGWAAGGSASGSGALALAALVGANSPLLSSSGKTVLAALFAGNVGLSYPAGKKIVVKADSVTCLAGDVDITRHSCDLVFGKTKVTFTGRPAHEIYATLVEVGVPADGALGTIYEALSQLSCTIDPTEVKQRAGGGATCQFTPGRGS
jgi:hypothetical protein